MEHICVGCGYTEANNNWLQDDNFSVEESTALLHAIFPNYPEITGSSPLRRLVRNIRHELHANSVRAVESAAATLFGAVTDSIRAASRIVQARNLTPEAIRETCNLGLARIFQSRE